MVDSRGGVGWTPGPVHDGLPSRRPLLRLIVLFDLQVDLDSSRHVGGCRGRAAASGGGVGRVATCRRPSCSVGHRGEGRRPVGVSVEHAGRRPVGDSVTRAGKAAGDGVARAA